MVSESVAALLRSSATISDNLAYVQKELPKLDPPPDLRQRVVSMCHEFQSALEDVNAEIRNLEAFLIEHSDRAGASSEIIAHRLEGEVDNLHLLVTTLRKRSAEDAAVTGLEVLVTESAGNILYAYIHIRDTLAGFAAA